MAGGTVKLTVRLAPHVHEVVSVVCERHGVSLSEYIRSLIGDSVRAEVYRAERFVSRRGPAK